MAEEGLSAEQAVDAVLRDNLHGLEIDDRCCQIAAFALALAAWTYTDAGGYRQLPDLHIACTGIGPQSTAEEWVKLAEQSGIPMSPLGREPIKNGLLNLHRLFSQAPTLGSLINPSDLPGNLIAADYETIKPYLAAVLKAERTDDETHERAIAAAGMAKAADLLAGEYTLVITNVPYLQRGNQDPSLRTYIDKFHSDARANLATAFMDRGFLWLSPGGTSALVITQGWLFLVSYGHLREKVLMMRSIHGITRLGHSAFEKISGHVVNVALTIVGANKPSEKTTFFGIDVEDRSGPEQKALGLSHDKPIGIVLQSTQRSNLDFRIDISKPAEAQLLTTYASFANGIQSSDRPRFIGFWWERPHDSIRRSWSWTQTTSNHDELYGGCICVTQWDHSEQCIPDAPRAVIRGTQAWGKDGLLVSTMSQTVTRYMGGLYDENSVAIIPEDIGDLAALWMFCCSSGYKTQVRKVCSDIKIRRHLLQVPFQVDRWRKEADEVLPKGLPEPESDDPVEWLFHGWPMESVRPLQVAVARLLDYRWPAEHDDKMRLSKRARELVNRCDELAKFADGDGIVCIPSVRGEEPAAERLLALLVAAGIKPARVQELTGGIDLDDWLRNNFFEEHCSFFHHMPFVWHIWDGRKRDGFHALVNYHKLCEGKGKGRKLLESLTYSYLGDWITRQKDEVKRGEGGAEDRLATALELQNRLGAILEGEPPFDIFVRWKPLTQQPIGWEPDINDGVRMNIRPFMASDLPSGRSGAGVLRWKPNIKWTKDRGKEPERPIEEFPWFWNWDGKTQDFMGKGKKPDGNRHNDCHYTNKVKQAARYAAKKGSR